MGQVVRREMEFTACQSCRAPIELNSGWSHPLCPSCLSEQKREQKYGYISPDDPDHYGEYTPDRLEEALGECGFFANGCLYAGTEHCDWDCPLHKPLG